MKFFLSLLTILFIGLKLSGNIDWSWWVVFSPVLITIALAIIIGIGADILERLYFK